MKNLVILTGAGISAESGIPTFRGMKGMWENVDIEKVATPQGWKENKELVLRFYNDRRKHMVECKPNKAHLRLVDLEKVFNVNIITQNVDDLHDRAGSKNVLHIHGELTKSRSTLDPNLVYIIKGTELNLGDKCEKGSQLRPHIVWFYEDVPLFSEAMSITKEADVFAVIGTSLVVYPAASLLNFTKPETPIFVLDPSDLPLKKGITHLKETAVNGIDQLIDLIMPYV